MSMAYALLSLPLLIAFTILFLLIYFISIYVKILRESNFLDTSVIFASYIISTSLDRTLILT